MPNLPITRKIKNVVKQFTPAEVKVREATSNDPWGPTTAIMSEIAEWTFNVIAFVEIMNMIWKRLGDQGKKWRHVFKSLVLLDYLIKTGSEKVAQQCRENIINIQSLKKFQYVEEGKDHGQGVREKAKQLTSLLNDEERYRNERTKAMAAKERFAQNTSMDSGVKKDSGIMPRSASDRQLNATVMQDVNSEIEAARPSNTGEEDLQLQLAMAMSKEVHEEEEKRRKGDELKLQIAIEESKKLTAPEPNSRRQLLELETPPVKIPTSSTWDGQLSQAYSDPWSTKENSNNVPFDPWAVPVKSEVNVSPPRDPWSSASTVPAQASSRQGFDSTPWNVSASNGSTVAVKEDEFDLLSGRPTKVAVPPAEPVKTDTGFDLFGGDSSEGSSAWEMSGMKSSLPASDQTGKKKKVPTATLR